MNDNKNKKTLEANLDDFLDKKNIEEQDCNDEGCIIKTDKSLVERINKKIITEDGRQLLF
jgi:hypothetical protein